MCKEASAHLSTSQSRYDRVALLCTLKRSDRYDVDSWQSPTLNEGILLWITKYLVVMFPIGK